MDDFNDNELTIIELELSLASQYYAEGQATYQAMQEIIRKIRRERLQRLVEERAR